MEDHLLIADMRKKSKSQNEYDQFSALLFALQIPSICSRIEIPQTSENTGSDQNDPNVLYRKNGKPWDRNLYFTWLQRHQREFAQFFFRLMSFETLCEAIYDLRNNVTHAGSLLELDSRIVFIESDDHGSLFSGRTLYTSISKFCDMMFNAARDVFSSNLYWYPQVSKADKNLTLHTLSKVDFDAIRMELEQKYHEFWAGRDDDLKLYQTYCFGMIGHLDKIEQKMRDRPDWSMAGLSRIELERLVKVVHECDTFGDNFDAEIAEKYFKRK